jgi:GNAT superfamily N-acetyltransferase
VSEQLLENPRTFAEKVAGVLGGRLVARPTLTGFVSSDFDPFLNHLFASGKLARGEAAEALQGRPGFVWLAEEPAADEPLIVMQGMTADLSRRVPERRAPREIIEVRSTDELDAWHGVYSEVFGADPRSRDDWRRLHAALGRSGDGSLLLLLALVDRSPAATGGVFFAHAVAGLYCFTTREGMRGRGLATALVHASHAAARAKGIERAVLQATPSGRPVYARVGYREKRPLPVLSFRRGDSG